MAVLPVSPSPSPARVHGRGAALCRFNPAWIRLTYRGGPWSKDHYRVCSWCGCIHPADLIALLNAGDSLLRRARPRKHLLLTPNPIAGQLFQMGSIPGPVFPKHRRPADIPSKFLLAARPGVNPTAAERLAEHYDRPCFEPAPDLIIQPFYAEHTTEAQWLLIETAAEGA
jgi:hypothetical protein